MNLNLDQEINKILESGFQAPRIFKRILNREIGFSENEEILGFIHLQREYLNSGERAELYSSGRLIVATTHGVILAEEGMEDENPDYGGYRMRYLPYSKITCLELDTSLLLGVFKISPEQCSSDRILLEFDKTRNLQQFENLNQLIHAQIVKAEMQSRP